MLNDVLEVVAQNLPIIREVCHHGYAKLVMEVLDHSRGRILHNDSYKQTFDWQLWQIIKKKLYNTLCCLRLFGGIQCFE